jgi:hypothetical protein
VPALAQPLVYDAIEVHLLSARDFQVTPSVDYGPAYPNDAVALRISGRFTVAVPVPVKSVRKLTITPPAAP